MTIQLVKSTECRNDGLMHTIDLCAYDKDSLRTFQVSVLAQQGRTPPLLLESSLLLNSERPFSTKESHADVYTLSVEEVKKTFGQEFNDFLTRFKPSYINEVKGKTFFLTFL